LRSADLEIEQRGQEEEEEKGEGGSFVQPPLQPLLTDTLQLRCDLFLTLPHTAVPFSHPPLTSILPIYLLHLMLFYFLFLPPSLAGMEIHIEQ
jgi:hypothetical protein